MSQLSEVSFEILVHKTVLDFYGYHSFYSRPEHCMPLSTSMLWLCQRPLMKSRFKLELIYIMQFASFQPPSTFGKTSQRMSHWFFLQFCVESQYNFVFISKVTASFALFFFCFFLNIYASTSEYSLSLDVLVLVFTRDVSLLTSKDVSSH